MRWTGLILSIAIVGLTIGLFLATGSASTTQLTIRPAETAGDAVVVKAMDG